MHGAELVFNRMRRCLKYVLPGAGLVAVLILAAVRAPAEIIIYAGLVEICIFVVTDPYRIIHYWLSTPARAIIVTIIIVDTVVIRTHLSTEYVAIPIILSLAAFLAIYRFNVDWRAQRAYKETPIVSQAMAMHEESSEWKSYIYHGKSEIEEMAYRIGRYTGKQPFNQNDVQMWQSEQQRIESRESISNVRQCISVERMKDFLGMCYRLGYIHALRYRKQAQEESEKAERIQKKLEHLQEENENLELDLKSWKKRAIELKNADESYSDEIDSIREYWQSATEDAAMWKKRCEESEKENDRSLEYIEMQGRQIESLQEEKKNLEQKIRMLESQALDETELIPVSADVRIIGKTNQRQAAAKKKLPRMTEADKEKIYELRKDHTVEEVSKITGWSEKSVKRATAELKEKVAVN